MNDAAPKVPPKREQMEGSSGKLEIYPLTYVHPTALDTKEKYMIELVLSGSGAINLSIPKPVSGVVSLNG